MATNSTSGNNSDKIRESQKIQTRYGIAQGAKVDSDAEVTERQEYDANGLPQTEKYAVDKDGKNTKRARDADVKSDERDIHKNYGF